MGKPDHNYRPNPSRSICVFGEFDEKLVASLAAKILELRASAPTPITVYINSEGGSTRCLETIHSLLKSKDCDGKRVRIITVAVGVAGSAAATLMALGDYAIAYPEALIHFHGVRLSGAENVTMEDASGFAKWLKETNDATAGRLGEVVIDRLAFHYDQLKSSFDENRKKNPAKQVSDVECFAECLKGNLSASGTNIVNKSIKRWRSIKALSDVVFNKLKKFNPAEVIDFEAGILREIVRYEIKQNKGKSWALDAEGIAQVVDDYTILRDYHIGQYDKYVNTVMRRFAPAFLDKAEFEELKSLEKLPQQAQEEWVMHKVSERFKPFVYFTITLCRYLQEQENRLTPEDAYWLGAVDEIAGSDLPCLRTVMEKDEFQDPAQNLPNINSESSSSAPLPPVAQS